MNKEDELKTLRQQLLSLKKKNAVLLSFYWFTKKDIPLVLQLAPFIQVLTMTRIALTEHPKHFHINFCLEIIQHLCLLETLVTN